MANDPQEQPSHAESVAAMAGTKSFHPKKSPPADLVSLFQTKDLQNEIKQILQHHKTSHSDQMFVPHMNFQIFGSIFHFSSTPFTQIPLPTAERTSPPFPSETRLEQMGCILGLGRLGGDRNGLIGFTMDKPILSSALLFWSGSFSYFHFPCGAMSMSLFDISSLTGLRRTEEEISALLTLPPGVEYNSTDMKPSYPALVRLLVTKVSL
ncbi:hypothetical protein SLEP1_g24583 [Rubroshorea leprosula]|uniref:Uncharacterized protein n=1 Tax=Rubroshorea leprosula TaxID=152421 RepID=A0AAV5JMC5_9ROSI|nr:hypothetical protein SLEP1_g24583 [Rubroshorea leprosula]